MQELGSLSSKIPCLLFFCFLYLRTLTFLLISLPPSVAPFALHLCTSKCIILLLSLGCLNAPPRMPCSQRGTNSMSSHCNSS
uniref:Uncharacterized protein n=1 Tax=Rhipicephalus pulchellus TaxID=72859 RepID=L7LWW1_RHIPC